MKPVILAFVLMFTIFGNLISLLADDTFPTGEMADGNFVPGTVLIYDHGKWLTTEGENVVNPEKYTFVIIHGAHCSVKNEYISQLATVLAKERPDANILAVDWSEWSSVTNSEIADWIVAISFKLFRKKNRDEVFLASIFEEIAQKAIPVEQAKFIPKVSERLTWKLFGDAGKTQTFTTYDLTTKEDFQSEMTALGLSPEKTHLIGHSHGAHVAGLTGMAVRKNEMGQLDWISALDPSTSVVHEYSGNLMGTGWGPSAARLVAIFRTSYFFSSERKATNDSLFFDWRDPDHPIKHPKSGWKIAGWLKDAIQAEFQYHSSVFERFTKMIQETGYLDEDFEQNEEEEMYHD